MPYIEVAGSRIACLEQGRGEPVLLLHCSASSSAQWRGLIDRLSPRFRVLAPDFYGYGGSAPWPGGGPLRLEHEAAIVRALLDVLDTPARLVGHSYGGAVALHYARMHPERLASLVLIEPVAFHLLRGHDRAALAEIEALAGSVGASLAAGDYLGGLERFVDYWSGPGAWAALPAERRARLAPGLAKVALDFHATLGEPASPGDFAGVSVPTLLIQGSNSPRPARRICELLAGALPAAERQIVAGAGHMAPLTHAQAVNRLVARQLDAPVAAALP
jgi:pimeloyl-ACP methyl ester carboxylesterase